MNATDNEVFDEVKSLLDGSIGDVFKTVFARDILSANLPDLPAAGQPVVAGSVGFIGDLNGMVYLFFGADFARELAGQFLGDPLLGESEELVNDVVGELSNMVVGAVKSQLCDRGRSCVLTIPSVLRGVNLTTTGVQAARRQSFGFRCGDGWLLVELHLKPGF
ncbi:MAG: chemotaxis protein CheX [Verrucomicrobiota bacterium]